MSSLLDTIFFLPRSFAIAMIKVYQKTLSPDHGPLKVLFPDGCCIHTETCSMYGKRVIKEQGLIIGGLLTFKRILTCTPWHTPDEERALRASH